jgi:hypothetical protein
MAAAKAMVLARFEFALNCVAVGNFAFCHGCEETILAFGIVFSSLTQCRWEMLKHGDAEDGGNNAFGKKQSAFF